MDSKQARVLTQQFLENIYTSEHVEKLRELIRFHDHCYRILHSPIIDDTNYDTLYDLLIQRESQGQSVIPTDSPTQLVWTYTIDGFEKLAHRIPMLSLQNTYTDDDVLTRGERCEKALNVNSWEGESDNIHCCEYIIEPKLDWSSIQLVYRYGKLTYAATRWNGYTGEDVSAHSLRIWNLPHTISQRKDIKEVVLRAEVVMPEQAFERINTVLVKSWWQVFANARNAASGTLRNLDASLVYKRGLQCYVFEMLGGIDGFDDDSDMIEYLRDVWLPVHPWVKTAKNIKDVIDVCSDESVRELTQFGSVACDGLVVKINQYSYRDALWFTEHHPRRAIAYKYPAQEVVAYLRDIQWQVGRTWVLTPVAELTPVAVGWVVVQRATLHNFSFIQERNLSIWADIWIKRSWEVIPYVIGLVETKSIEKSELSFPTMCPVCDHELMMSEDFKRLICLNIHCQAQQKERLKHYVSRDAANIEGLWWRMVEVLYDNWLVSTIESLYELNTSHNTLKAKTLEGIWDLKRDKIIQSISFSKGKTFGDILYGIGIVWIWKKLAKTLTAYYQQQYDSSYTSLYLYLRDKNTKESLLELYGIWEELANAISERSQREETKELINSLESHSVLTLKKLSKQSTASWDRGILVWKTIVITGWFELGRKKISENIEKAWWIVTSAVSKSTDFLVVGKKPWSKVQKASALWVEILSGDELISLLWKESVSETVKESNVSHQQNLFQ